MNSVSNILSIIKQTDLRPEDVNIIVANSDENKTLISQLGDDFSKGETPLKGETHKKFTFCTSTAYAGCDFYSTNASTFAISDCRKGNTTIDVATELVQIAGRQRLDSNPFKSYLTFIYNTDSSDITDEQFMEELQRKVELSHSEIEDNNSTTEPLRAKRVKDCIRMQKAFKYSESFTMYDSKQDRFVFNRLAYVNEIYRHDLQNHNYENGVVVKKQLSENGFDVTENQSYRIYEEQLKHIVTRKTFVERMKYYCDYRARKGLVCDMAAMTLETNYPELKYYYDRLGGDKISALSYKEASIKSEIRVQEASTRITYKIMSTFTVGERMTTDEIKAKLHSIYTSLGLKKAAVATDLKQYFNLKPIKITAKDGRKNGFVLDAK